MTDQKLFIVKCHTALREWFYHGREEFDKNKEILNRFLNCIGPEARFLQTYDDLYDESIKLYNS